MFLRCKVRRKDGKQHRYWSVVENTRVAGGRVVQRHVLYLGEINDTQELAWRRSIAVIEDGAAQPRTLSLFPEAAVKGCWRTPRSSASSCRSCGCAGHGNGARAGWRWCCGGNCSSISSGRSGWGEPQGDALGSGPVAGGLPPAGTGQRMAPAPRVVS